MNHAKSFVKFQSHTEFSPVFPTHNAYARITRQFRMLAKPHIPIGNLPSVLTLRHARVITYNHVRLIIRHQSKLTGDYGTKS